MEKLIKRICSHPFEFSEADFAHCGVKALVRICQELNEEAHPVAETVEHHHERVLGLKMEHLIQA